MMRILKTSEWTSLVIEASKTKPVLVDFTATWCEPCKVLMPALKKAAAELNATVDVYKLDIDKSVEISNTENIRSVPTMILYVDGKPAGRISGVKTTKQITTFVSKSRP